MSPLVVAAMLALVVLGAAGCLAASADSGNAPVRWTPRGLELTVARGSSLPETVNLTAAVEIESLELVVVPELAALVTVAPTVLTNLAAGETRGVTVTIDAAAQTPIGQYEGVILARAEKKGLARPFPIIVHVGESIGSTGGTVVSADSAVSVAIPLDALVSPVTITLEPSMGGPPTSFGTAVGPIYDLGPSGTTFARAIAVTMRYDPARVPADFDPIQLRIAFEDNGTWIGIPSNVDLDTQEVTAELFHFTRFVIVAAADITPPAPPTDGAIARTGAGVVLSWIDPSTDFGYSLVYRLDGVPATLVSDMITTGQFTDPAPTGACYRVRAVDPAGNESVPPIALELCPQPVVSVTIPWGMTGHDAQHSNRTALLGPTIGEIAWTVDLADRIRGSPVVGVGGILYVATVHSIRAISPTGATIWEVPAQRTHDSPVLSPDGSTLYVLDDFALRAVATGDGQTIWTRSLFGCVGPTIDNSGIIYVSGCSGVLHAFNPDGSQRFASRVSNTGDPSVDRLGYASISRDGDIYVASNGGQIFAVGADGVVRWQFPASGSLGQIVSLISILVAPSGTVYVPIYRGDTRVIALSSDGNELWRLNHSPGSSEFARLAMSAGNTLYIQAGKDILAVDAATGALQWERVGVTWSLGGIAVAGDGTLYVGGEFLGVGGLRALNPDGSDRSFIGGACFVRWPIIGTENLVFSGNSSSCGDQLIAFR